MITKHLVEKYGGDIWLESEPGVGSKFSFKLKIIKNEEGGRREVIENELSQIQI